MTTQDLIKLLEDFIHLPGENEVVEFKKAQNGFDKQKLGEYFSALSNEANLSKEEFAWLLFGIDDKTHVVSGSSYKPTRPSLDAMKREIAEGTNCGITFTEIHEIMYQGKRIIMFQIPAAPKGIPTSYKGHYYGRHGESLAALSLHELESIRHQNQQSDWSARIVKGATLDDLDPKAISIARSLYSAKNKKNAAEIAGWDDITFLNKAKLSVKGKITNAAIVLLGKEESEVLISPAVAKIRWILKDSQRTERDYEIKSCPFIISIEEIYQKIRIMARAMVGLQMVDTIGSGIRKMFDYQRQRLFPLPDYFIENDRVQVTIIGKILNMEYANILAKEQELSLVEIEALNRIQLNRPVSDEEVSHLRRKKLVEGRKPNLFIAKPVAQQLDQKTAYSNNKGFEDRYYCDLILKALTEHSTLNKQEITQLLWNKFPDVLSDDQKYNKVTNLLTKLRLKDEITNKRQVSISYWQIK